MTTSYSTITELPNEKVPLEQILRITERYCWASKFAIEQDVLECACGAGQGADLLNSISHSYVAADYDKGLISIAKQNNPVVNFKVFDALNIPFDDGSFDVVLICEALYYFSDISKFLQEAKRVLRRGGKILIVSANPGLFDFNPSPFTYTYPSVTDMGEYFNINGFKYISAEGGTSTAESGLRQKLLRPVKLIASRLNLIPKTMKGKSWLKKMFFGGEFVSMPNSIVCKENKPIFVNTIEMDKNDTTHKVLYFVGEKIL
jgi:SAM-dependent methyltransferase